MILLFGEKAENTSLLGKNTSVKNQNNPVENSGILAMNGEGALSYLNAAEYDDFISSNPVAINYTAYSQWSESESPANYATTYSQADYAASELGGSSFGTSDFGGNGGFAGACAGAGGCSFGGGSFSSVC